MISALSNEWFERVSSALASAASAVNPNDVGEPEAVTTVEVVITGGDPPKVPTRWQIESGLLVEIEAGHDGAEPADLSAPIAVSDFEALIAGELDPAVAFMRGDLKPEGSSGALLAFMSALNRTECREALASVV